MTQKPGVMMPKIHIFITGINLILKYIQIETRYLEYYCFYSVAVQINIALVSISDFF